MKLTRHHYIIKVAGFDKLLLTIAGVMISLSLHAFNLKSGSVVKVEADTASMESVAKTALKMLRGDIKKVLGSQMNILRGNVSSENISFKETSDTVSTSKNLIILKKDAAAFAYKKEAFQLKAADGNLYIIGSDDHGLAYGILEVSRLLGVSPWEWWADAKPKHLESFSLEDGYQNTQAPSVEFRGIFVNDEDWGLMPWSGKTYEPSDVKGHIGPKTNARIFELLLRLRANTYWPAMHECTRPFFLTEGNREVARQYGIYIGGSHCEPMASNAAGEWKVRGKGDYDFVHNKENVLQFWEDRVKEVANQPILYTIGMRGVHDGAMQGAKTVQEQKTVLDSVFQAQRDMLAKYVCKNTTTHGSNDAYQNVTQVPQLFIPYKEVLDVYHAGLQVPEDVCLVWCDDNYGMVRHFPTAEERARKGGNGIYYHVSYWGRPHDYLWLGTFSPSLMFQQMSEAWHKGIQKFWILNVGDIKPAEYQIELFLDMAWNMDNIYPGDQADKELLPNNEWLVEHEQNFWTREFGKEMARKMLPVMQESYRLAYIRKPEFMGNTRTEESDPKYKVNTDLPWSEEYIKTRLADYKALADKAGDIEKMLGKAIAKGGLQKESRDGVTRVSQTGLPKERKDEFYQLFKYPVQAAAQMNNKLLYAQLARHGKETSKDEGTTYWSMSDAAFDSIARMTKVYNEGYYNHGKWNRMMDFQPRKQPVFNRVPRTVSSTPMVKEENSLSRWNATECSFGHPIAWYGLGYEGKAAGIAKNTEIGFEFSDKRFSGKNVGKGFSGKKMEGDSVTIELRMVPTHPMDDKKLRIALTLDGGKSVVKEYQTEGRSEQWKVNTLQCQARIRITLPIAKVKKHRLAIKALDDGVVLDQVYIY